MDSMVGDDWQHVGYDSVVDNGAMSDYGAWSVD